MKTLLILSLLLTSSYSLARNTYPLGPELSITPGSLCSEPEEFRYPEKIAYCGRYVTGHLKDAIFASYRKNLGYELPGDRSDYKIDHFIPLCAGGSNYQNNLWPQHITISRITDPIEAQGCEKLAKGLISQKDLVNLIYQAKTNIEVAPEVLRYIQSLR